MRLCLLLYPFVKHCYFAFLYQQYDYFRLLLFDL